MSQRSSEDANKSHCDPPESPAPEQPPTVVLPLDGTAESIAAWPVARTIADIEGATLHIIYVGEPEVSPREVLQKLGLAPDQSRSAVINQATGAPVASILHLVNQWQSRLIVMCTHTHLDKPRDQLGSVAEGVLSAAPCPVALVRPERGMQPWALHRILLPQEGTPTVTAAVRPAADLAYRAGAELIVLHIVTPGAARPKEPGTFAGPRYLDQPQHEWPVWGREFLQRLRGLGHPPAALKLRLLLANGEPGTAIIRSANEQNSDLIVLAWRGHLEGRRSATIKEVIHNAPCPVLIVPVDNQSRRFFK